MNESEEIKLIQAAVKKAHRKEQLKELAWLIGMMALIFLQWSWVSL